jgi:hypothetical protein
MTKANTIGTQARKTGFGSAPLHRAIQFSERAADNACEEWGFNCGPGAVCGLLGLRPEDVRASFGAEFEAKGYTNPTLMCASLRVLSVQFAVHITPNQNAPFADQIGAYEWPRFGLARVQWDGPWVGPGIPIAARYRKTHWVASVRSDSKHLIFDVNIVRFGGWCPVENWSADVVPWLLKEAEPKANGRWWVTHSIEVTL